MRLQILQLHPTAPPRQQRLRLRVQVYVKHLAPLEEKRPLGGFQVANSQSRRFAPLPRPHLPAAQRPASDVRVAEAGNGG
jgi:hypothetical protein